MLRLRSLGRVRWSLALVGMLTLTLVARAEESAEKLSGGPAAVIVAARPLLPASPTESTSGTLAISPTAAAAHPLSAVLESARAEQAYLQRTVQDFTCRLVKRERIEGVLQDYQVVDMRVREESRIEQRVDKPLGIFLNFVAPSALAGRRVLYVAGENDGKMLVRGGGTRLDFLVLRVDPHSQAARSTSLVPITEVGFRNVLAHMINVLEIHAHADPTGENTLIEITSNVKQNEHVGTLTRVVHPKRTEGLQFHIANVFVDDTLHVPVRIDFSDWPEQPDAQPPLLAEYIYTDLKLNVHLPESAFLPAQLRAR